eukprot:COSAG05_NODE_707_length_7848_cov_6.252420_5_plen_160_part_00
MKPTLSDLRGLGVFVIDHVKLLGHTCGHHGEPAVSCHHCSPSRPSINQVRTAADTGLLSPPFTCRLGANGSLEAGSPPRSIDAAANGAPGRATQGGLTWRVAPAVACRGRAPRLHACMGRLPAYSYVLTCRSVLVVPTIPTVYSVVHRNSCRNAASLSR